MNDEFYRPYSGWSANVYTGPFNSADLPKLDQMVDKLQMMVDEDLVAVTTWWTDFKAWLAAENKNWTYLEESNFRSDLADFLHSVRGARFSRDFRFNGSLDCNQAAPPLIASRFSLRGNTPRSKRNLSGSRSSTDLSKVLRSMFPQGEPSRRCSTSRGSPPPSPSSR